MNAALRRMGYSQDQMTAHGFRAAASTLLNESGKFNADAIERALAHQDADEIRRAYARGEHWQERVTMMQWWRIIWMVSAVLSAPSSTRCERAL
jgi:integrase